MGQFRFRLSAAAVATIAALTGVASARADGGIPGLSTVVNFGAGGVPAGGTQGGDSDDHGDRDDGGGRDGDDDDGGHDGRGDRDDDAEPAPAPGMTTVQTNHANTAGAGAPGPFGLDGSLAARNSRGQSVRCCRPRRRRSISRRPAAMSLPPRRRPPSRRQPRGEFRPRLPLRPIRSLRFSQPRPGQRAPPATKAAPWAARLCPDMSPPRQPHPTRRPRRNRHRRARWARVCRPKLAARRLRRQPELRSRQPARILFPTSRRRRRAPSPMGLAAARLSRT